MEMNIRELRPPSILLRAVDPASLDMTLLADSIDKNGLLVPITICPQETGGDIIVDGNRRWLVCKGMGWETIATHPVDGDPQLLRIIAQTRETTFGRDDKRAFLGDYLLRHKEDDAATIAHRFQWSPIEVESLAGVEYLIPDYLHQYKAGGLTLLEVWQLSRVREEGQLQLLNEETDEPVYDRASAMHREVRAARRRNMATRPRGKGYNKIVKERDNPTEAGLALIKANAKTPMDGWSACLNWILSSK